MTATTTLSALRHHQIAEALGDVEEMFFNPGAFGDCSLADAATSLASELDGAQARARELEATNREAARRLDEAMSAIRAVIAANQN